VNGILSPSGDKVLHDGDWIQLIHSPDGLSYYHENNWHSLQESRETPSLKGEFGEHENDENQETEKNNTALWNVCIIAVVIALMIYPYPYNHIVNISLLERAGQTDCSGLSELGLDEQPCEDWKTEGVFYILIIWVIAVTCLSINNKWIEKKEEKSEFVDDETAIELADKALKPVMNRRQLISISLILFILFIFLFIPFIPVENEEFEWSSHQTKESVADLWACDGETFCTSDVKNLGSTVGVISILVSLFLLVTVSKIFADP